MDTPASMPPRYSHHANFIAASPALISHFIRRQTSFTPTNTGLPRHIAINEYWHRFSRHYLQRLSHAADTAA
jgi:hypothetical protein